MQLWDGLSTLMLKYAQATMCKHGAAVCQGRMKGAEGKRFPACDLWTITIKTVTCSLTKTLIDYSWDDVFQDFTVGV